MSSASGVVPERRGAFEQRSATLAVLLAALSVAVLAARGWQAGSLRRTERAFALRHYERCVELGRRHLHSHPGDSRARLLVGESLARLHHVEEGLSYLESAEEDGGAASTEALICRGIWLARGGRIRDAEGCLRHGLALAPQHAAGQREMAFLLHVQGRTWEAVPYALAAVRQGDFNAGELIMAGNTELRIASDEEFVGRCLRTNPRELGIRLGEARVRLLENDIAGARALFQQIVAVDPRNMEAQARLGRVLANGGDQGYAQWHRELPADADNHPEIWFTRGQAARHAGEHELAARCFWEALQRHPFHTEATYQLSQQLASLGRLRESEEIGERARLLARLQSLLGELENAPDSEMMRQVVELMEGFGRGIEARGWTVLAARVLDSQTWPHAAMHRLLRGSADVDRSWTAVAAVSDLHSVRLIVPGFDERERGPDRRPSPAFAGQVPRFTDVAGSAGVLFEYNNGSRPGKGLEHIFESTGGGLAAVDFDCDGWPDLYAAQSCDWRRPGADPLLTDRLFRNQAGGRFQDVTAPSHVRDAEFSQGVTAGDFNDDGFPDIFVCNLGADRLYLNCGDGTFADVTGSAGTSDDRWSLSAAFADFNEDGNPDLFVVNYLETEPVIAHPCKFDGQPRACVPTMFPGATDRLYLSNGNGTFRDATLESGLDVEDGKGLGLVVADFRRSGQLDVFVGNDTAANFFFEQDPRGNDGGVRFAERGAVRGIAFDESGSSQATMGIAAGDANADGILDLFVTNFYAESNTMYLQSPGGDFEDSTRPANLRDGSFYMLGFGTQFLDAELDGLPDLVLTNGHVDRTFATGEPDVMPPQFYRNTGAGGFEEIASAALGPYFEQRMLGRALIVLDWNRDGRPDFCVTHLDCPLALLENETAGCGHFVGIRLVGTTGARVPVGAVVTARAGEQTWLQQLTAGDGYQSSNQLQLLLGLGESERLDELLIEWQPGVTQRFENVRVNQEYVVVEGRSGLFAIGDPITN